MSRSLVFSLLGIVIIGVVVAANPADDAKFNNALAVQQAMARARAYLSEMQAKKAVDVLEEALPKVSSNPQYLLLLREAYRSHIRGLWLANQPDQAKRYLDRLCILEPSAAQDGSLKPAVEAAPRRIEIEPATPSKLALPNWKLPTLPNPFAKKEEPKNQPLPQATIRAQADFSQSINPFDPKFQREAPVVATNAEAARDLLARGAGEFKLGRYAEARTSFELAQQADPRSFDVCKDQWAYCIIHGVSQAMDAPGAIPAKLPLLRKQVEEAIEMAPTKMMKVGQELLQKLDQRGKAAPALALSVVKVDHLGTNKEGWQVTQSRSFRVFHKQNPDLAERVAQIAEATRSTMYRKWFDTDGDAWEPRCELVLHPTSAGYTNMTGVPNSSPGHARIEVDMGGRVVARRLDLRLDVPAMTETVLPHETTHAVLAGNFGMKHVPRWVDEGIAVLSEPNEKIEQHRRNLHKQHKDGLTFTLKELMELPDYPNPRRIGAFYAQSVVLVEFMTQQRGAKAFTDFVKDGMRYGYPSALQKHYQMTFTQLDQLWLERVLGNQQYAGMK
ncbi:MAG: hypothetical protein HYR84_12570 [Planctomycetes bacterium]|nr:hypothetical protein [Planctomycetota bacterium]